jgi:hypothetical protein
MPSRRHVLVDADHGSRGVEPDQIECEAHTERVHRPRSREMKGEAVRKA